MTLNGGISALNSSCGTTTMDCSNYDSCYNYSCIDNYSETFTTTLKEKYVTYDYLQNMLDNYEFKHNANGTVTFSYKGKDNEEKDMRKDFKIVDYRTYENRVVIVTFEDYLGNKTEIKSVCNKDDKFDLERGVEVCVFKYLHGEDTYKQIIKEANRQIKAVDKAKEDKKAQEELIARKKAKAARKKARRMAKQRQNRIDEMKEAYFEAMVKHDSYLKECLYEDYYK